MSRRPRLRFRVSESGNVFAQPNEWGAAIETMKLSPVNSLIIPVYKNAESLHQLLLEIDTIAAKISGPLEVVFVIDGSPDASYAILRDILPDRYPFSHLICLSRNFGSFAAIRAGLARATGKYSAVMAADLQDPPDLISQFFQTLATEQVDIVIGARAARVDPGISKWFRTYIGFSTGSSSFPICRRVASISLHECNRQRGPLSLA